MISQMTLNKECKTNNNEENKTSFQRFRDTLPNRNKENKINQYPCKTTAGMTTIPNLLAILTDLSGVVVKRNWDFLIRLWSLLLFL